MPYNIGGSPSYEHAYVQELTLLLLTTTSETLSAGCEEFKDRERWEEGLSNSNLFGARE